MRRGRVPRPWHHDQGPVTAASGETGTPGGSFGSLSEASLYRFDAVQGRIDLKPGELSVRMEDIRRAYARLRGVVHRTPLIRSRTFSEMAGAEVYLKLENLQRGGSFKIRGAYNKIASLRPEVRKRGVIAASAGNHAQGVALAARSFGVPATVVMPEHAPLSKQGAVLGYGAEMILEGSSFEAAYRKARRIAGDRRAALIETYDDKTLIAGHGTIGLEIAELLPDVDGVIVPVGGGGLIAGIGIALKDLNPRVRVYGVQSECFCGVYRSFTGAKVAETGKKTIADGIAIKKPGRVSLPLIRRVVSGMVTVSDDEIARAVLFLMERKKVIAEGAGAAPLAALMSKKIRLPRKKIVLVVSGGNIDVNLIERIIERGLLATGRLLRLKVRIQDAPGALGELAVCLGALKANILEISHDRASAGAGIGYTCVPLLLETHGSGHNREIRRTLKARGYEILA